jgi:hypothetical protein
MLALQGEDASHHAKLLARFLLDWQEHSYRNGRVHFPFHQSVPKGHRHNHEQWQIVDSLNTQLVPHHHEQVHMSAHLCHCAPFKFCCINHAPGVDTLIKRCKGMISGIEATLEDGYRIFERYIAPGGRRSPQKNSSRTTPHSSGQQRQHHHPRYFSAYGLVKQLQIHEIMLSSTERGRSRRPVFVVVVVRSRRGGRRGGGGRRRGGVRASARDAGRAVRDDNVLRQRRRATRVRAGGRDRHARGGGGTGRCPREHAQESGRGRREAVGGGELRRDDRYRGG